MRFAKLSTLFAALALAFVSADAQQTKTITTYVFGNGSASEPDRSQSMDEATQQAQNWANSTCMGTVTSSNTTSSSCIKTGSDDENNVNYTCMVTVKAACEIEYRGR
jgi:hypothetical protein